jgi:phosphatidate cytidylyltransferase
MLIWRLTLGPIFIAALAGLCWLDLVAARPGMYLLPLAVVLALAAAVELLAMFRKRGNKPLPWAVYGGTLLTVLAAGMPVLWQPLSYAGPLAPLAGLAIGLAAGLVLVVVGEMRRYESPGQATMNLALSTFAILYAGGLIGFLVALRLFDGGDGRRGMVALVSLVAVVKLSDIGQYTAGRLFGKHKLAPTISPGKTWEGALGGLVGALLGALVTVLLSRGLLPSDSWELDAGAIVALVIYAVVVAVAGMLGDLAESLLKRDAGLKDSSTWLPGFGGVLDLLDSLLLAAPVAYTFWALRLVGP